MLHKVNIISSKDDNLIYEILDFQYLYYKYSTLNKNKNETRSNNIKNCPKENKANVRKIYLNFLLVI
jgi:hypothetical protein